MDKTLSSKIQIRRDTHANWSTNDPVLESGEMTYDITYQEIRIGNGVDHWSDLRRIITRETVIDLIMDTSLARDLINEWMEANRYEIADGVLYPIIQGTWFGCYLNGAENSPIELTMTKNDGLDDIELTNYTVLYKRTINDSPTTVNGTLSFQISDYSLDYTNITWNGNLYTCTAGTWERTYHEESGDDPAYYTYTFVPNIFVTTTYKIEGNYENKIWRGLKISVS